MRTTLDLDERVMSVARSQAKARGVSLGRAVSDLALEAIERRHSGAGSEARIVVDPETGFPVLHPPSGAPVITSELVAELLDEW